MVESRLLPTALFSRSVRCVLGLDQFIGQVLGPQKQGIFGLRGIVRKSHLPHVGVDAIDHCGEVAAGYGHNGVWTGQHLGLRYHISDAKQLIIAQFPSHSIFDLPYDSDLLIFVQFPQAVFHSHYGPVLPVMLRAKTNVHDLPILFLCFFHNLVKFFVFLHESIWIHLVEGLHQGAGHVDLGRVANRPFKAEERIAQNYSIHQRAKELLDLLGIHHVCIKLSHVGVIFLRSQAEHSAEDGQPLFGGQVVAESSGGLQGRRHVNHALYAQRVGRAVPRARQVITYNNVRLFFLELVTNLTFQFVEVFAGLGEGPNFRVAIQHLLRVLTFQHALQIVLSDFLGIFDLQRKEADAVTSLLEFFSNIYERPQAVLFFIGNECNFQVIRLFNPLVYSQRR